MDRLKELDMKTELTQNCKLSLPLDGKYYEINVKYEDSSRGAEQAKTLRIDIPGFPTSGRNGMFAEFKEYAFPGKPRYASIKGDREYGHNRQLEKAFVKKVQPFLEETLPRYMMNMIYAEFSR